jgi:hypothetical protein
VTLLPGEQSRFIGLIKVVQPHRGLLVRPSTVRSSNDPAGEETEFLCATALPHFHGWCLPSLPFATLCGFAARAISLSSSRELAHGSLVEYLETFLSTASYPAAEVMRLARAWDDAHPCSSLSCTRAALTAVAAHKLR